MSVKDLLESTGQTATVVAYVLTGVDDEGHETYSWQDIRTANVYYKETDGQEQVFNGANVVLVDYLVYMDEDQTDITEKYRLRLDNNRTCEILLATPVFGEYVVIKAQLIR